MPSSYCMGWNRINSWGQFSSPEGVYLGSSACLGWCYIFWLLLILTLLSYYCEVTRWKLYDLDCGMIYLWSSRSNRSLGISNCLFWHETLEIEVKSWNFIPWSLWSNTFLQNIDYFKARTIKCSTSSCSIRR